MGTSQLYEESNSEKKVINFRVQSFIEVRDKEYVKWW